MSGIKIVGISVDKRTESAPDVQEILTEFGDEIISRFGVHDVGEKDRGLITLNFVGDNKEIERLREKLYSLEGVNMKYIDME